MFTILITLSKHQKTSDHLPIDNLRGYKHLEYSSEFSRILVEPKVEIGRNYIMPEV